MPRQYLYSTHGEIALAEGQLDDADSWFAHALVEAEKYGNQAQAANIRAANERLKRAEARLVKSGRKGLQTWARQLRAKLKR